MRGQWTGRYDGTRTGDVVLDMDEGPNAFSGVGYLFPDDLSVPASMVRLHTPDQAASGTARLFVIGQLDPHTHDVIPHDQLQKQYPTLQFPTWVDIAYAEAGDQLTINWIGNNGNTGTTQLERRDRKSKSEYTPKAKIKTWDAFKRFATNLPDGRYIFRGQADTWKLVTTFHRTNRTNIVDFLDNDVNQLHRALRTNHYFYLPDPLQYAAFVNLVQHHGYPTPMLDWSHSPFVAAFFAFHRAQHQKPNGSVRIFVLDKLAWQSMSRQYMRFAPARPHISFLEPLALENERAIPQQSLMAITNVEDIEWFIRKKESESGTNVLEVIDLPRKERAKAMRELSAMGITAGAMFPGLDGTCEALKEKMFVAP